jgi:molybdopterin molybdotransferase
MTLDEAVGLVTTAAWRLPLETVSLSQALGRYLAEPVLSDSDLPPFDRSMLDGFACRAADLPGPLSQVECILAGETAASPLPPGACVRIMTGAPAPEGADFVFGIEHAETTQAGIVYTGTRGKQTNIARRGEDVRAGDTLLTPGTRLLPQHLAVLATAGRGEVRVASRPSVGILATGTELVPVSATPTDAQIRNSNSSQLAALAQLAGAETIDYGIVEDDREMQREALRVALDKHDLVLSTGGVSVGDRDYLPELLAELGLAISVRKVDIQPGKPIVFGTQQNRSAAAFALAGNPLSSYVQFLLLVQPFLAALQGGVHRPGTLRVTLREDISRGNAARTLYRPLMLHTDGTASPPPYHGSGHITSYTNADALAIVPAGILAVNAGDPIDVLLLH